MDIFAVEQYFDVSPITAISTLIVIFLGLLYYTLKNKGPPGPRGLPFIGYWPFLKDETINLQLQKVIKKYGDVFSFTAFGRLYIHLGSIKAVKEAHITKSDCFSQRDNGNVAIALLLNEGVVSASGEAWKVQRKFFVQAFREFGLTSMKDYMAGPVYDSVNATVDDLRATAGKPVNITKPLIVRCTAILRRMMFNDEGMPEEELNEFTEAFVKSFNIFSPTKFLLSGGFARRFILPLYSDYKSIMECHQVMVDILRKMIRKHEEQFDKDSIRDMIDSFIKERNDRREKNDPSFQYFTETGLISSLIQFMGDGISTIAIFIGYFLLAVVEHPEEQEKIFKEIEEVVGHDRQATLEDKSKMPYTNAFMQEVERMTTFFPLFPSLECTKETTINGHKIPKGAITLVNFVACHTDPKVFENPTEFRPSRFLTAPGKPKQELPIFFGVGKRSCIGESFTRMQTFLFLTTIIKNFELTKSEGHGKKHVMDGSVEICAHPRK